jgi:glucose-1-phosphatase
MARNDERLTLTCNEFMIKAIILDLGKVIVPFDFNRAWLQIEARYGISPQEIRRRLAGTGLYDLFESGLIDPPEFLRRMNELLDIQVPADEFWPIWTSIFLPETLLSDEFLELLSSRRRLVLLSNTNIIHFEMIRSTYPLLRHFHRFVLSYELGVMKPRPEIYLEAARAGDCKPEECFFADDIQENVDGALRVGIDAVQFVSASRLESELRQRGLI